MLDGTQMIVAVEGTFVAMGCNWTLWVPLHPAACPQRPGSFISPDNHSLGQAVVHLCELCPMSLTAGAKAAYVPGSHLGISSQMETEPVQKLFVVHLSQQSESWFIAGSGRLKHKGL